MSFFWPFGKSVPKTKKELSEEKTTCMNKCEAKYNEELAKLPTEQELEKKEEVKPVENPEVVKQDEERPPEKVGGGKRKKHSKKNKKSRRKRRTRKSKKCKK